VRLCRITLTRPDVQHRGLHKRPSSSPVSSHTPGTLDTARSVESLVFLRHVQRIALNLTTPETLCTTCRCLLMCLLVSFSLSLHRCLLETKFIFGTTPAASSTAFPRRLILRATRSAPHLCAPLLLRVARGVVVLLRVHRCVAPCSGSALSPRWRGPQSPRFTTASSSSTGTELALVRVNVCVRERLLSDTASFCSSPRRVRRASERPQEPLYRPPRSQRLVLHNSQPLCFNVHFGLPPPRRSACYLSPVLGASACLFTRGPARLRTVAVVVCLQCTSSCLQR
jgi:hypothetical protein